MARSRFQFHRAVPSIGIRLSFCQIIVKISSFVPNLNLFEIIWISFILDCDKWYLTSISVMLYYMVLMYHWVSLELTFGFDWWTDILRMMLCAQNPCLKWRTIWNNEKNISTKRGLQAFFDLKNNIIYENNILYEMVTLDIVTLLASK